MLIESVPTPVSIASVSAEPPVVPTVLPEIDNVPPVVAIALTPVNVVAAKLTGEFVVLTVPFNVVVLAVLVKPLVKLNVPALPNVTPFVLLNVVALVMVLVAPFITTFPLVEVIFTEASIPRLVLLAPLMVMLPLVNIAALMIAPTDGVARVVKLGVVALIKPVTGVQLDPEHPKVLSTNR